LRQASLRKRGWGSRRTGKVKVKVKVRTLKPEGHSYCNDKHWSGWVVAVIVLTSFAVVGYEYWQVVSAFRSGRSPVAVAQETRERDSDAMANAWIFSLYQAALLALLFPVVRKIRKARAGSDYLFLGVLLVAIATLVRNFVKFH